MKATADNYPRFPLYVVSKGRAEYMMTSKALSRMGVQHNIIVEPQEIEAYSASIAAMGLLATVVPLDLSYKGRYDCCDKLGLTKSTGPGPARNFAWEHSVSLGAKWHWVMDDNIKRFYLYNRGLRVKAETPAIWRAMEDFVLRYCNVAMAGPMYAMFAFTGPGRRLPPFIMNTRIYSCNLIRNDVPFR